VGKTLTVPSSGKPGFSRFLLATGPGTAYDGGPKPKPIKNGNAILIVVVNDAQAVPAGEPRDFVFNPNDPWAGLPKEGFFAILWSDRAVFIKPDTTPEQLKALFTVDGETVDIEKVTTGLYERFLWPE
jgi:hypothetical protein